MQKEIFYTSVTISPCFLVDDPDSRKVEQLLETLESIDDDCSAREIHFVKIASDGDNKEDDIFGIDKLPKLVYFKDKIPNMYEGKKSKALFFVTYNKNISVSCGVLIWIKSVSFEL